MLFQNSIFNPFRSIHVPLGLSGRKGINV